MRYCIAFLVFLYSIQVYGGLFEENLQEFINNTHQNPQALYDLGVQFRKEADKLNYPERKIKSAFFHPCINLPPRDSFSSLSYLHAGLECFSAAFAIRKDMKTQYNLGYIARELLLTLSRNRSLFCKATEPFFKSAIFNLRSSVLDYDSELDSGIKALKIMFEECERGEYRLGGNSRTENVRFYLQELFKELPLDELQAMIHFMENQYDEFRARLIHFFDTDWKSNKKEAFFCFFSSFSQVSAPTITTSSCAEDRTAQLECLRKMLRWKIQGAITPLEKYNLGRALRKGEDIWRDLPEKERLIKACEIFSECSKLDYYGKSMHEFGMCSYQLATIDSTNSFIYLTDAFRGFFKAWENDVIQGRNNIKNLLDQLNKKIIHANHPPYLYLLTGAFSDLLTKYASQGYPLLVLSHFFERTVDIPRLKPEILERINLGLASEKPTAFYSLINDFFMNECVAEKAKQDLPLDKNLIKESFGIAKEIQKKTSDRDAIVFIGRSLPWVQIMLEEMCPTRKIINLPFSLTSKGKDKSIASFSDLSLLGIDEEIEAYQNYLRSLGFGIEGSLDRDYERFIFVDVSFTGTSIKIFDAILRGVRGDDSTEKIVYFPCILQQDVSDIFGASQKKIQTILISQNMMISRSYKYGVYVPLIPGILFGPDKWKDWENIETYRLPQNPVLKARIEQAIEYVNKQDYLD